MAGLSVYSFYIFDRHTECIYTKRWTTPPSRPSTTTTTTTNTTTANELPLSAKKALKLADDAKLIFGTIFSLRRMVRQLGGQDDQFLSYRTGEYKLHYFETPTQLKLIMLTDTRVGNMRTVLHQIWATLYVEYVVKSPLAPVEHPKGMGVANELFEGGLETFIASIFAPVQGVQ
ncbi:Transport protein [Sphaerulina musiva]